VDLRRASCCAKSCLSRNHERKVVLLRGPALDMLERPVGPSEGYARALYWSFAASCTDEREVDGTANSVFSRSFARDKWAGSSQVGFTGGRLRTHKDEPLFKMYGTQRPAMDEATGLVRMIIQSPSALFQCTRLSLL
jgi:hypothetical protein